MDNFSTFIYRKINTGATSVFFREMDRESEREREKERARELFVCLVCSNIHVLFF